MKSLRVPAFLFIIALGRLGAVEPVPFSELSSVKGLGFACRVPKAGSGSICDSTGIQERDCKTVVLGQGTAFFSAPTGCKEGSSYILFAKHPSANDECVKDGATKDSCCEFADDNCYSIWVGACVEVPTADSNERNCVQGPHATTQPAEAGSRNRARACQ
jgi:hypothetical protein